MYNFIKWGLLVLLVVAGIIMFESPKLKQKLLYDPGLMYVTVTCKTDGRGVTYCRDSKTGRAWTITPSPTGTRIA